MQPGRGKLETPGDVLKAPGNSGAAASGHEPGGDNGLLDYNSNQMADVEFVV